MYIGSHVSIRNGFLQAAKAAHSMGATAFQYFPKNPRSVKIKEFDQQDAASCLFYCQEHKIVSISHTPYPTNLIPETETLEKQIIASLKNDLAIADACGSIGIVVHFGSAQISDPLIGYKKMIQLLNSALEDWDGHARILLENNAGISSQMGITLEEMVQVRKLTNFPEKIGFCFDTCHAYASGLWNGDNWKDIETTGVKLGYFEHLKAIHLNNSKYSTGKRKDRHANLMEGFISEPQWTSFLNSHTIQNVPLILETPNNSKYTHESEIELVKNWIKK